MFDQRPPNRPEPNRAVVNYDDAATSRAVIAYLASLGHREIGIIDGDRARYAGMMKHRGFLAGMRANGLPVNESWMRDGDFQSESGYRAMRALLAANKRLPTAMAAANDNTAFGAMRAMEEFGLRIPEDISIVGVDGHPVLPVRAPAPDDLRVRHPGDDPGARFGRHRHRIRQRRPRRTSVRCIPRVSWSGNPAEGSPRPDGRVVSRPAASTERLLAAAVRAVRVVPAPCGAR